jgi:periplasmic protein TonB
VRVEPKRQKKPDRGKLALSTPKEIPGGVPDEAEPGHGGFEGDLDDAFDGEVGGAPAEVQPQKAVVVEKKEAPPPPPAPVFVTEREHATSPRPLSQPKPAYPAEARADRVEGTVVVRFLVTTAGTVGDVRLVSGDARLAPAVIDAVKRWRFEPGTYQGRPVPIWRSASFPFRLRSS